MAEEIGIVMSLYDKVSPTLKTIGNNTKAFDKNLQELEQSCKSYEKSQESLVKDISTLKSKLVESNQKVKEATKAWKAGKDELSKEMLDRDRGRKVFLWSGNALSFLVGRGADIWSLCQAWGGRLAARFPGDSFDGQSCKM